MLRRSLLFVSLFAMGLSAQGLPYVKEHYTKYEYEIPMRDGKKLFTAVYVPKDRSKTYPILLNRTPYSVAPYGVENYRPQLGPSEQFGKEGYIFAYQDVRGRYLSEGVFLEMTPHRPIKKSKADVDESSDTYDTVEWMISHVPVNNGKVGLYGISYPGFYAAAGMIDAHPALKAVSPQAPIGDLFMGDDAFHNGAFMLAANFGFYTSFRERKGPPARPENEPRFQFGTPSGYEFYLNMGPLYNSNERYLKNENPYWSDLLKHPNYDEFWKARNLVQYVKDVQPAVLMVGGWFDAEDLAGPLRLFRAVEENGRKSDNTLVMGPWPHGGWARIDGDRLGDLTFGDKTSLYFREKIEFPFFEHHLKGKGSPALPKAYLFETGTNQWRKFEKWPPQEATAKSLYLRADGKLTWEAPADNSGFDEYVSDPAHPVPYLNAVTQGMASDYMTADQRFASTRPDVLVYQTDPLEEDVTIAGPVTPKLFASTSGTDSDWVVKLIDVYPADYPDPQPNPRDVRMAGYQQLVRGEPIRGKFRRGFEKPEPFQPGRMEQVRYSMPDVCHTFRRGHRIMVQVQSSWFPLVDRNPQKFTDIPNARPEEFQKATQRIYRSRAGASAVEVLVLP